MRRYLVLGSWLLLLCVGAACSGDGNRCSPICEAGRKQCALGGVMVCSIDARTGCLDWTLYACPSGETCDVTEGTPKCQTQPTSPKQCDRELSLGCSEGDVYLFDACKKPWKKVLDCPSGTSCEKGKCRANEICSPSVECRLGTTRCYGNSVQLCRKDQTTGCAVWSSSTECLAGQICLGGQCQLQCTGSDSCNVGAVACFGKGYRSCVRDKAGCGRWTLPTQCKGTSVCIQGKCVEPCRDPCTLGSFRCFGDAVQQCTAGVDPRCPTWSRAKPCEKGYRCQSGECILQTTCADQCVEGYARCVGTALQLCKKDLLTGCTYWQSPKACGIGQRCQNGACGAAVTCVHQCKLGEQRCNGDSLQSCEQNPKTSCLVWGGLIHCPQGYQCKQRVCVAKAQNACGMTAEEDAVLGLVNAERKKAGLAELRCHAKLVVAARAWSQQSCSKGAIDHTDLAKRFQATGLPSKGEKENVAAGHPDAKSVFQAWWGSPAHRANMMGKTMTHAGVGLFQGTNCKGFSSYWTNMLIACPRCSTP